MRDLRKLVSGLVIVSFSVAALMGIVALLGGGEFGETEGRVLMTTVIVGIESVAALCYLAVAGRRFAIVGAVGGLASAVATATALWVTWGGDEGSAVWRTFGVAVTLAASLAQACLLLALVGRRSLRVALLGTLLAISVVAVMIIVPIVTEDEMSEAYWRAFGVVAILDVLGTVVLTALGAFGRRPEPAAEPGGGAPLLTVAVEARVVQVAGERGVSPSQLVSDALDALLAPR